MRLTYTATAPSSLPARDDVLDRIAGADVLKTYLPMLTSKQRRTLLAWADGKSGPEIAAEEGITRVAAHYRITGAIRRLRELAGVDGALAAAVGR